MSKTKVLAALVSVRVALSRWCLECCFLWWGLALWAGTRKQSPALKTFYKGFVPINTLLWRLGHSLKSSLLKVSHIGNKFQHEFWEKLQSQRSTSDRVAFIRMTWPSSQTFFINKYPQTRVFFLH